MLKRTLLIVALSLYVLLPARIVLAQEPHPAPSGTTPAHAAAEPGQAAKPEHDTQPPLVPNPTDKATQLQALWTLIIFVIMLAILYPTAWKNVLAGLKKREERIRADIAEAEAARVKAAATLQQYNAQLASAEDRIRQMLSNATVEGEKIATNIRMKAQAEAEEIKERSQRDIEAARDAAINDFRQYAAEVATSAAEKIIRRNLNPADQQELVRQSLEQLQTLNKN